MNKCGRHYVYIVEGRNGSLYTGYTIDLEKRIATHNQGRGAKCLRGNLPVKLVYFREYRYFKNAINAEIRLKKLSHKDKADFVARRNP